MARRVSRSRSRVSKVQRLSRMSKSSAASSSKPANWRSVAVQAASGMLLTRPIFRRLPRSRIEPRRKRRSRRSAISGSADGDSIATGTALLGRGLARQRNRRAQGLLEVFDDVLDMLDSDAQPDRLGADPSAHLLVGGHLAMGGRSGMAA